MDKHKLQTGAWKILARKAGVHLAQVVRVKPPRGCPSFQPQVKSMQAHSVADCRAWRTVISGLEFEQGSLAPLPSPQLTIPSPIFVKSLPCSSALWGQLSVILLIDLLLPLLSHFSFSPFSKSLQSSRPCLYFFPPSSLSGTHSNQVLAPISTPEELYQGPIAFHVMIIPVRSHLTQSCW